MSALVSARVCPAFLSTEKYGEPLNLSGAGFPCLAVIQSFTVPAEGMIESTHAIRAVLSADAAQEAPSGAHLLVADFNIPSFPTLRRRFEVE
ncbi:MAG: hypothetical protein RQ745_13060 [Longimicrobiales bacterium]|nr:hypothetical protein [Longimicrobiales bacterium]